MFFTGTKNLWTKKWNRKAQSNNLFFVKTLNKKNLDLKQRDIQVNQDENKHKKEIQNLKVTN